MRILFILEPVAYGGVPSRIEAHFRWLRLFERLAGGDVSVTFAMAANSTACRAWSKSSKSSTFEIDGASLLSTFKFQRPLYSKECYSDTPIKTPLCERLAEIKEAFKPDLVISSGQNAFITRSFPDVAKLYLEQAPLIRSGQPFRTYFDPCGHQTNSLLETHFSEIIQQQVPEAIMRGVKKTLGKMQKHMVRQGSKNVRALEQLHKIKTEGKVAIFATQPPDAVTYEGAGTRAELENLVLQWGRELPTGWIGLPTYHSGYRLHPEMEQELVRASPNLRFLSGELAVNSSETLLPFSDGLVTISSSSAMTAAFLSKPVVVTGRSPFAVLGGKKVQNLDRIHPINPNIQARLFGLFTHHLTLSDDLIFTKPKLLIELSQDAINNRLVSRGVNLAGWSYANAQKLFNFE